MRIIHKYLLTELAVNAFFTFLVLTALVTMLQLSLAALKASLSTLPLGPLLTVVAMLTMSQLHIVLPMTVLVACIWTYGRSQSDGEMTAMRGAGVPLGQLIQPALLLGAAVMFLLTVLQDSVIPDAHYKQREITRTALVRSVNDLISLENHQVQDSRFRCEWKGVGRDDRGFLILEDFVLSETPKGDQPPVFTRARRARPRYDPSSGELTITLEGLSHATNLSAREMTVRLDLSSLTEKAPTRRGSDNLHYDELMIRSRGGDPDAPKYATELHRRGSAAASALAFALFGALFGLVLRWTNRALIFTAGFVVVLMLSFGPSMVGTSLARRGIVPPELSLWVGNVIIIALSLFLARRARMN